ncbi:MAG TPA: hypothetical protein VNA16_08400 [Abditibacteriaceae bacterium]|nr:hypothetical protein [Abditibacteriaceae bacterium]
MTRILFDAFHHMMPGHRIGRNIVVGGYQVNFGRYTPGDCFHPNGLSFLHADLAADYDLRLLTAPYSELSLFDADILFVANPDYPLYERASPYRWTPLDVDALLAFVQRGGGVLLLVNSFLSRPDYWEENFDHERVNLLFDRLGVRWDHNFMSDDATIETARCGELNIGYGQGGRVFGSTLPAGIEPLLTHEGDVYGFQTAIGAGLLMVIGDAGLASNGLVCFPGFDNAVFMRETFARLKPPWTRGAPGAWDFARFGHISAAPSQNGLHEDIIRNLRPQAQWIEDHHYRHLAWDRSTLEGAHEQVWQHLPMPAAVLHDAMEVSFKGNWLRLDNDEAGPQLEMNLSINTARQPDATDIHVIGRTRSGDLTWADLCDDIEPLRRAGEIDQVHTVFEMKLVLDADGRERSARWSQGQILYARNPTAGHYGYEIILNSASGVIAPRASQP